MKGIVRFMRIRTFSLILFVCSLTACSTKQQEIEKTFSECQRGFIESIGNQFVETPYGYYALVGDYLGYLDENMDNLTLVCSKPDCLHNQEEKENVIDCNAFAGGAVAIQYHEGKIYTGGDFTSAFVFYGDDILCYEKRYESGQSNPKSVIIRFPVESPEKEKIIYENSDFAEANINNFMVYEDYCYFRLDESGAETDDGTGWIAHGMKIDLKTNEVKKCCEFANRGFLVGKDRLICRQLLEYDTELWTGSYKYYECTLDGEKLREITKEDYKALDDNTNLILLDDEYVYLSDINYGGGEVPASERYIYVYTYSGTLVAKIPTGEYSIAVNYLSGNEKYFIIKDRSGEEENRELVCYVVDKSKFGKGACVSAREVIRVPLGEYTGYTY